MARPSSIKSGYLRSHIFWWGVALIAAAAILIGWNAIKETTAAMPDDLQTVEGRLVEYRGVKGAARSAGKPGKRRGASGRRANILRIEKADGTIAEFSSRDWITPPKSGWTAGQPIRVKHDSRGNLYEVVVGNETLRDVTTMMQRREEQRAQIQRIAKFLLAIGAAVTVAGYLAARQRNAGSQRLPRA